MLKAEGAANAIVFSGKEAETRYTGGTLPAAPAVTRAAPAPKPSAPKSAVAAPAGRRAWRYFALKMIRPRVGS